MLRYALKQLRLDWLRSLLTLSGIAAVVAVILVLQGFAQGVYAQLRTSVFDRGGDLIATQAGVANMAAVRSVIPQLAREKVEEVPGVETAHPLTGLSVIYEKDDRKNALFLVVYDTAGGPTKVKRGRGIDGDRQIIIDESLAGLYKLGLGDELIVSGFAFEIVGITEPNAAIFTPFAFTTFDTLIDFYFESSLAADLSAFPLVSYFLIDLEEGADRLQVAQRIEEAVAEVDVFTPEALAERDAELGKSIFAPIIGSLIVVAYLAGVLVVGLFTFAAASSRRRDIGVLKALGFRTRHILVGVLIETGVLTALALPLGVGLAHGLAAIVESAFPLYLILPAEPGPLTQTVLACVFFALLGALAPLRLIHKLEPAMVFQS